MNDENNSEKGNPSGNNKVAETINAVTGLTQSVSVYQDLIQPAAQELGKGLAVIAKSINSALLPLRVMVWKIDDIERKFIPKVTEKLKDTKPEDIITPKANIAVPLIEALRYSGDDDFISDVFANLLASAMDKNKADNIHPSFVEIIKQLSSNEAVIIKLINDKYSIPIIDVNAKMNATGGEAPFIRNYSLVGVEAGINSHQKFSMYVDNLCRLGICEIPNGLSYMKQEQYDEVLKETHVADMINKINSTCDSHAVIYKKCFGLTSYGKAFTKVCIG
ncbi:MULTISPECIES: DUF4393 domain-containing protein [Pectobacterium]|uniref:DUF4393 domain-containing protein n=1 Tax=Pectobacterium TaxID=122277 RepID=UPI000E273DB7|nr:MULTISPECIES: DUF4393 domain-containing protein [Pectobacterium]RRO02421.1 DUF4393 domain-containing protein [Pectobacterium aquaticum]